MVMSVAVLHESTVDAEAGQADHVEAESRERDRRSAVRLSAEDATWLRSARLKYGPDVRIIDVSTGGILVESDGAPLEPQTNVVFELTGPTGTMLVPSRVLRSHPVPGSPNARYHAACAFKRALSIETLAAVTRHEAPAPAPAQQRATWQRVVARFRNGRVVRGYTNDFHPSKSHLHLTPEDKGETQLLALSQLKAVFFVREFAGDPARVERAEFGEGQHGRKIEVTFEDGEILLGTTLAYRGDGAGFFVHPADSGSNNMRVFVAPGSTLHVRFL
jgi:hypothetical protein